MCLLCEKKGGFDPHRMVVLKPYHYCSALVDVIHGGSKCKNVLALGQQNISHAMPSSESEQYWDSEGG